MGKLLNWIKKIIKLNKEKSKEYRDCIRSQKDIILYFGIDLFTLRYGRDENDTLWFDFSFLSIKNNWSLFSIFRYNKKSTIYNFLFIYFKEYRQPFVDAFMEIQLFHFILLKTMLVLTVFQVYFHIKDTKISIDNAILSLVFNIKHKMPERLYLLFIPFGWLLRLIYGDDGQRFINKKTK
jgi:hypothetical protein